MVGLTRPTCGIYLGILSMARSRKLLKLGGQWAASVMTQMKTLPNKKTGIQKYLVVNKQPQLWREWKLFRRLLWHSDYLCTTLKLLSSGDQGWRDCLIWYKYNITTQIQIEIQAGQTKGKGEGFWCEGLSDGKYRLSRRPLILIVWPPEVECSTKPWWWWCWFHVKLILKLWSLVVNIVRQIE